MIKIYCDGVYIEQDNYAGLTKSGQLFTDSFRLGATLCEQYKITLNKDGITAVPSLVELYEDDVKKKTLFVDSYKEDDYTITLSTADYMLKANISYDASPLMSETGETTLKAILDDICQKIGVTNGVGEFFGQDMAISWYNNGYSARSYIGFIAEMNASYAYVTVDNELRFQSMNSEATGGFDLSEVSDYKIGAKHQITRVVWDDNNNKWEFGDTSGDTYYINTSNVYITEQSIVEEIYDRINGYTFFNFKTSNCPLDDIEIGSNIIVYDGAEEYPTIAQITNEVSYSGGYWIGGIELDVNTTSQEETKLKGQELRLKHLQTIVDRNTNTITQVVAETEVIKNQTNSNLDEIRLLESKVTQNKEEVEVSISQINQSIQVNQENLQGGIDEINKILADGVENVKNTLVTININGIQVATNTSAISTIMTNDTFAIQTKGGTYLAYFGYDEEQGKTVAEMDNLTVTNYFTAGYHRQEKMTEKKRTGWFFVGGSE